MLTVLFVCAFSSTSVVLAQDPQDPPVTTETLTPEEQAAAEEAARIAELTTGLKHGIQFHRDKTWYWQKLSFKSRTKSSYEERQPHGVTYLQWMKNLWQKRHVRAKRYFMSYKYADRPLEPHQARVVGQRMAKQFYGWVGYEWRCLNDLWGEEESSWRWWADNPTSDAYGIPQALPGSKMGPGWAKSVFAQIKWGLRYIKDRFFSPCGALAFHNRNNWY